VQPIHSQNDVKIEDGHLNTESLGNLIL